MSQSVAFNAATNTMFPVSSSNRTTITSFKPSLFQWKQNKFFLEKGLSFISLDQLEAFLIEYVILPMEHNIHIVHQQMPSTGLSYVDELIAACTERFSRAFDKKLRPMGTKMLKAVVIYTILYLYLEHYEGHNVWSTHSCLNWTDETMIKSYCKSILDPNVPSDQGFHSIIETNVRYLLDDHEKNEKKGSSSSIAPVNLYIREYTRLCEYHRILSIVFASIEHGGLHISIENKSESILYAVMLLIQPMKVGMIESGKPAKAIIHRLAIFNALGRVERCTRIQKGRKKRDNRSTDEDGYTSGSCSSTSLDDSSNDIDRTNRKRRRQESFVNANAISVIEEWNNNDFVEDDFGIMFHVL